MTRHKVSSNSLDKNMKNKEECLPKLQQVDMDPLDAIIMYLEKKARNLEKKKSKGLKVKELCDQGKSLNEDQKACAASVYEVVSNIDLLKEIKDFVINTREKQEQQKVVAPSHSKPESTSNVKLDTIKRVLENHNLLNKLAAMEEEVKSQNYQNAKYLSSDEVAKLMEFKKFVKISESPDSSTRLKKVIRSCLLLLNKEKKPVDKDIPLTYEEAHDLILKILPSLQERKTIISQIKDTTSSKTVECTTKEPQPDTIVNDKLVFNGNKKSVAKVEDNDGWIESGRSSFKTKKRATPRFDTKDRHSNPPSRDQDKVAPNLAVKTGEPRVPHKQSQMNIVITDITSGEKRESDGYRGRNDDKRWADGDQKHSRSKNTFRSGGRYNKY